MMIIDCFIQSGSSGVCCYSHADILSGSRQNVFGIIEQHIHNNLSAYCNSSVLLLLMALFSGFKKSSP